MIFRKTKMEVWKPVLGYEGYYEASDYGQIRSIDRCIERGKGIVQNRIGVMLKACITKRGYLKIVLCMSGNRKTYLVHRLVLLSFVGPCPVGMEACHDNGIRTDNRFINLRWDTKKNNQEDKIGHHTDSSGERHPQAKLTCFDVKDIRDKYSNGGVTYKELAKKYDISQTHIGQIVRGENWKDI